GLAWSAPVKAPFSWPKSSLSSSVSTMAEQLMAMKDRKSTRLNSSHLVISYAVFCLKKKKKKKKKNIKKKKKKKKNKQKNQEKKQKQTKNKTTIHTRPDEDLDKITVK